MDFAHEQQCGRLQRLERETANYDNKLETFQLIRKLRVRVGEKLSAIERAAVRREFTITRSVRAAVIIHVIFNTIPFFALVVGLAAMIRGSFFFQFAKVLIGCIDYGLNL